MWYNPRAVAHKRPPLDIKTCTEVIFIYDGVEYPERYKTFKVALSAIKHSKDRAISVTDFMRFKTWNHNQFREIGL